MLEFIRKISYSVTEEDVSVDKNKTPEDLRMAV